VGAVRIYKYPEPRFYAWQVRTGGCTANVPFDCGWGLDHDGYCVDSPEFEYILDTLNDPNHELGAYLKK
jgi:hypothetical protein